jgi:CheY-like chemotaxis protein
MKGIRILCAEDNHALQIILGEQLRELGYIDTVFVGDGVGALVSLHALPYDLLITDIEMPNRDGIWLIRELRKNTNLKDLPVIVFSTIANHDRIRQELQGLGIKVILTKKPVPMDDLKDSIASAVGPFTD